MTTSDLPLFAYATAPHNGTETSAAAAESIKPSVLRRVLDCIASMPQALRATKLSSLGASDVLSALSSLAARPDLLSRN